MCCISEYHQDITVFLCIEVNWVLIVRRKDFSLLSVQMLHDLHSLIELVSGVLSLRVNGQGVKLTTHLNLVPMPRMVELYLHSRILLHGPGATLTFMSKNNML
jgi:hypothetical protein